MHNGTKQPTNLGLLAVSLLAELLHDQVGPLRADGEGLVRVRDVGAVQHQLHHKEPAHIIHTYSTYIIKEGKVEHHPLCKYVQLENNRQKVMSAYGIHTFIHAYIHTYIH